MPEHPINPASLVDIARYPLDNPQDARYRNTLSLIRAQLEQDGCAVIPGFLSSHGLSHLLDEAQERRELAYFSANTKTNVYFSSDDPSLAEDHPGASFSNEPTASSRVTATMNLQPAIPSITGPH